MKHKQTLIDWQRLCLNLRKQQPLAVFAREIGCDEKTLHRLANGDVSEPRFSIGLELLNKHVDLFPELHRGVLKREFINLI